MIKFFFDCQFFFCWYVLFFDKINYCMFQFKVIRCSNGIFLLQILGDKVLYKFLEYELCSEVGFLLGDFFLCIFERLSDMNFVVLGNDYFFVEEVFMFVLSKQSVLKYFFGNNGIIMFSFVVLRSFINLFYYDYKFVVKDIKFFLNGEFVYVVVKEWIDSRVVLDFLRQNFVDMSE